MELQTVSFHAVDVLGTEQRFSDRKASVAFFVGVSSQHSHPLFFQIGSSLCSLDQLHTHGNPHVSVFQVLQVCVTPGYKFSIWVFSKVVGQSFVIQSKGSELAVFKLATLVVNNQMCTASYCYSRVYCNR